MAPVVRMQENQGGLCEIFSDAVGFVLIYLVRQNLVMHLHKTDYDNKGKLCIHSFVEFTTNFSPFILHLFECEVLSK